jgi:acid ceramidase
VVTNDYRLLTAPGWTHGTSTSLRATSCGRFDRASWCVRSERPTSVEDCFAILDDKGVKMEITVQQMVMSAAQGWLCARAR